MSVNIIDWNTIDTVLLDMDGTLLDLHYDNYFWATHLPQRYAEIKGIPLSESQSFLQRQIQSLKGTLNWYCIDYWSDTLTIDVGKLKTEIKHKIKKRPTTQAFLDFLQEYRKTVALVTNAHPIGLTLKLTETNIDQYCHHIISSHQFQAPKEEQTFWHSLQEYLPFNPKRTLFIDDNTQVLNAAKSYGIQYTVGIHQPDSQISRRLKHTPAIHDFDEIMPKQRSIHITTQKS